MSFILLLSSNLAFGQHDETPHRVCYTDFMMKKNAHLFKPQDTEFRGSNQLGEDEYVVIPVVVHIIHNNGPENISDERVKSQITVLNEDFGHYGKYNFDERGDDTKIRFCLASIDPDGNPTTGILRVASPYTELDSDDEMLTKDLSRWNQHRYLNIWVVKSIDGSSNIQGYSYLPRQSGGPSFDGDGLILTFTYFGKVGDNSFGYKLGRTTTHEIGHYFDLIHTWGGDQFKQGEGNCSDDDGINDTPKCDSIYFSMYPQCKHPTQCGNTRMIENFMDYSTDACMKLFTVQQGEKMISSIEKYRSVQVSYANMEKTGCAEFFDSINNNTNVSVYPNPVAISSPEIYIQTYSKDSFDLTVHLYDFSGKYLLSLNRKDVSTGKIILDLTGIKPGIYFMIGFYAERSFQHKILLTNSFVR